MSADAPVTPSAPVEETRLLIERIVKALVDEIDQVRVTITPDELTTTFEVRVADGDIGKLIGKRGVHADAIRRILHAIAGKHRQRYLMEIIDDTGPP